jgi:hypothetical protein
VAGGQPGQIVLETLCQKKLSQKRAGGEAQGVVPEFKPQYHQKKKKNCIFIRKLLGIPYITYFYKAIHV